MQPLFSWFLSLLSMEWESVYPHTTMSATNCKMIIIMLRRLFLLSRIQRTPSHNKNTTSLMQSAKRIKVMPPHSSNVCIWRAAEIRLYYESDVIIWKAEGSAGGKSLALEIPQHLMLSVSLPRGNIIHTVVDFFCAFLVVVFWHFPVLKHSASINCVNKHVYT